MAENGKDKGGPDSASIKPVSSLLSHFEHLSTKPPKEQPSREPSPRFPKYLDKVEGTNIPSVGRASLDSPRPEAWSTPSTPRLEPTQVTNLRKLESPPRSQSPSHGHKKRPQSMSIPSSPQLTPALTVESPRSPPKGPDFPQLGQRTIAQDRFRNRSPENGGKLSSGLPSSFSSRPTTPNSTLRSFIQAENASTGRQIPTSDGRSRGNGPKSTSVPPPVNRADKPKIPSMNPKVANTLDVANLQPAAHSPSEDRVSPFSTPPSSEGSPSPDQTAANNRSPSGPDPSNISKAIEHSAFKPPPMHHSVADRRQAEQSLSRTTEHSTVKAPTLHHSVADRRQAEQPLRPRDPRELGFMRRRDNSSDLPEDRPGLPRRRNMTDIIDTVSTRTTPLPVKQEPAKRQEAAKPVQIPAPPRPSDHSKPGVTSSYDDKVGHFPPPPKRNTIASVSRTSTDLHAPRALPLQSAVLRESSLGTPVPSPSARRHAEDSDDHSLTVDDTHLGKAEYPDASHANRRPPSFRDGPHDIHIKQDSRVFDVCGQYICTTGYVTRVWDLSNGEQLLTLTHGESTVKMLSVAFKPGAGLEEEGSRIWLGSNGGEIHEVDIETQSIISTRNPHSRREVIKIYRHNSELWTMDDDGKFLVWAADESGMPNLQYSPHSFKVPKSHTFSMVVGGQLWLATGKDLRIFRPGAGDAGFQVLPKPLNQPQAGEITSGALSRDKGGCVYLGHTDGKVTIYSTKDYSCIGMVNVSVYKINNLCSVGDYLWAAFKTGMIYVYDTSTNPWTVKKDWHAHTDPVSGLSLDPSSVWKLQRLQVVSLGNDDYIRLWDGTLEDDWLENEMQKSDVEYCDFREIGATVLTWNAGASTPVDLRRDERGSIFIREALHSSSPPEIIVFGFQELVDLEDKKLTAKSLFLGSKKKDHVDHEHLSRQYRAWRDHLTRCVEEIMPAEHSYALLHTASLVGLFTCVFVKASERQHITNVHASEVRRGLGGLHGNKGALILRFVIDDSSICLVNCHLAAGQTQTMHRNNDVAAILEAETLPSEQHPSARMDLFIGGGDGSMILDHEICILNGDLNYRIDSMPRDAVVNAVKSNHLSKLLERDQLLLSKKRNPGFRLRAFNEAPINFAPTYKYDVGTDNYDSSEKRRSPAWCDRLLYRGSGRIKQVEYRRHEVRVSDHRPVSGAFKMRIKTVSQKKRVATWDKCLEKFAKEKRRLATEASVDYLVNVLGLTPKEARASVESGT